MPQISVPQVTGRGGLDVAVPQYLRREFRVDYNNVGQEAFEEIGKAAIFFIDRQRKIKDQNDELTAIKASSDWDEKVETFRTELNKSPITNEQDIADRHRAVTEYMDGLTRDLTQGLSTTATQAFKKHALREVPKHLIKQRADSLKSWSETSISLLDTLENDLAHRTVTGSPVQQQTAINTYHEAVNRALQRGFIDPINAEKRRQKFNRNVDDRRMNYLLMTGPNGRKTLRDMVSSGGFKYAFEDEQVKAVERANAIDKAEDEAAERAHAKGAKAMFEWAGGQANFGLLDASWIEDAKKGNNPYVTVRDARTLEDWNEKAKETKKNVDVDNAVRIIRGEFSLKPITQDTINEARARLNNLRNNTLTYTNELRMFGEHLQNEEYKLDRDRKSDRAAQRAETHERAKTTLERFDAYRGPNDEFSSHYRRLEDTERKTEDAWVRNEINKGRNPDDVFRDATERYERRKNPKKAPGPGAPPTLPPRVTPNQATNPMEVIENIMRQRQLDGQTSGR